MFAPDKLQQHIVANVRQFVERYVVPVASQLEHRDEYPHEIVAGMQELGLFGCNVPEVYGGLALDYTAFALIIEELARGWMSIVGPIGTHSVICDIINRFGTAEQRQTFLPQLASGAMIGAIAMGEPAAGSDLQGIKATALQQSDGSYLLNGS